MSSQLYPQVIDATNLAPRFSLPSFLPVGVEGQADSGGTGTVATFYTVNAPSDADGLFGPASTLGALIKFILSRGVSPVYAVASAKGTTPNLTQRQAAWALLESNPVIRLRMTDSVSQADLVGLADSAENAELAQNKQIAFGGFAAGTSKSTLLSGAAAIASKRFCLVAPGIVDANSTVKSGNYAAASVMCAVSKNVDIADDLDLAQLANLNSIERDSASMPIFQMRTSTGSLVNDFEDLLQGGVSPLQDNPLVGGVQITHLRTTWTTDHTFDALMTRLIIDQLYIDVRNYVMTSNFLRKGNTETTRGDMQAGCQSLLSQRTAWLQPVTQPDGTLGFNVAITPSTDNRQVVIHYEGTVVRGIQTIAVQATLNIPA